MQAWETAPIDLLFQPLPLAGDFDGNGSTEIAILPFHELILLEGRTGRIKSRCRFTETRSYGFRAYDFDHDGRTEFLVKGDFSSTSMCRFRTANSVLWQRAIELMFESAKGCAWAAADRRRRWRWPRGNSINLFNDTGDARWHLSV